jgi:F-BAR domain only protein
MNGSSTMASPPATGSTPAPQVDAEGYSIPPPDRKPWEMGAPGGPSDLMDDDEENDVLANL